MEDKELTWYTMKDESGKRLSDRQNIIFIDLKTIRKKINTPIEELAPVDKWGLFFSYVDRQEYADYIGKLVRSEKGIMAAENTVRYMSEADANWFAQNSRFIAERDKNTQIHNAEKRGREQGEQKKAVEGALMLVNEYDEKPEVAAQKMNAPLDLVLKELNKKAEK